MYDLSGWRFKAACRAAKIDGPDTPPAEIEEHKGMVYYYRPRDHMPFPFLPVDDDDVVTEEELEDFCGKMEQDVLQLLIHASRARRPKTAVKSEPVLLDDDPPDESQPSA